MPAENKNGQLHAPLPIEFWPGKMRLSAIVLRSRVTLANSGSLPDTLYKDWELAETFLKKDFGEYVFGSIVNGPGPGATMQFIWNPPITVAERIVPVRRYWTTSVHPWPAVVEDLQVVYDDQTPIMRRLYREAFTVSSDVEVTEYVSNTPFPRHQCATDEPVPGEIDVDIFGAKLTIPECLHPLVEVENIRSVNSKVIDLTPTRDRIRPSERRTIPATNHQTHKAHIFRNQVREVDGLFHRVQEKIYPPRNLPPLLSV
jgi:hypothetical protein